MEIDSNPLVRGNPATEWPRADTIIRRHRATEDGGTAQFRQEEQPGNLDNPRCTVKTWPCSPGRSTRGRHRYRCRPLVRIYRQFRSRQRTNSWIVRISTLPSSIARSPGSIAFRSPTITTVDWPGRTYWFATRCTSSAVTAMILAT
jgi:hypothetical protein